MAREDLHFRLRIPADLKAAIERAATDSRRSMTAEIIFRLEHSFDPNAIEELTALNAEIEKRRKNNAEMYISGLKFVQTDLERSLKRYLSDGLTREVMRSLWVEADIMRSRLEAEARDLASGTSSAGT